MFLPVTARTGFVFYRLEGVGRVEAASLPHPLLCSALLGAGTCAGRVGGQLSLLPRTGHALWKAGSQLWKQLVLGALGKGLLLLF